MMTEDETQEKLARMRAEADQIRENMAEGAATFARFFKELCENGMERGEALELTKMLLQGHIQMAIGSQSITEFLKAMGIEQEDEDEG